MPFELTNAPRTFARAIITLFDPWSEFMVIYEDDLVIYSEAEEAHLDHLRSFFIVGNNNNLSINYQKS